MLNLLGEWKEFGCWKDYNKLLEMFSNGQNYKGIRMDRLVNKIYDLYVEQLKADLETYETWSKKKEEAERRGLVFNEKCKISLAVKWIGKEGRALDRKTKCAKQFAKRLFPEEFRTDFRHAMRLFRKFYSPLQDVIRTTEKLMCAGRFDEIKFQFVPGKCLFRGKKAFLYEKKKGSELRGSDVKRLKCRENLMKHLKKAVSGNATVHGKTLYIHEMCSQVYNNWNTLSEGDRLTYQAQWMSHVNHFKELIEDAEKEGTACGLNEMLPLADFSGSMEGDPMAGAMAIALLTATLSKGPFSGKFMSFESVPQWISLRYPNTPEEFSNMMSSNGSRNRLPGTSYYENT